MKPMRRTSGMADQILYVEGMVIAWATGDADIDRGLLEAR